MYIKYKLNLINVLMHVNSLVTLICMTMNVHCLVGTFLRDPGANFVFIENNPIWQHHMDLISTVV